MSYAKFSSNLVMIPSKLMVIDGWKDRQKVGKSISRKSDLQMDRQIDGLKEGQSDGQMIDGKDRQLDKHQSAGQSINQLHLYFSHD